MNNNELIAPPPKGLTFFAGVEPEELAAVLKNEDKSVVSTVLVNLDEERAVKVFNLLPVNFAAESACFMADSSPGTVEDLAVIHSDILKKIKGTEQTNDFGIEVLLRLIKKSRVDRYWKLLDKIENCKNKSIGDTLFFTFHDIYLLDPYAMSKVLYKAERDTIVKAFKGTDRNFRARILSPITEDDFYGIVEKIDINGILKEIDSTGSVSREEVLKAREEIIQIIYELEKSGDIMVCRDLDGIGELIV